MNNQLPPISSGATAIDYDALGFIAGPSDTLSTIRARARGINAFETHIQKELVDKGELQLFQYRYKNEQRIELPQLDHCQEDSAAPYQFRCNWVPAFYSNQGLSFLWGGMALGFTDSEGEIQKGAAFSLFQLRDSFRHKERFLIYGRSEIISHESCHIARMSLDAIKYEELLAYRISPNGFRRYIGPSLQKTTDTTWFLVTFALFMAAQISYILAYDLPLIQWIGRSSFFIFIAALLWRNHCTHKRFNRALANLKALSSNNAEAIIFRLNDNEIDALGKTKKQDANITRKWLKKTLSSYRWQIVKQRFLT